MDSNFEEIWAILLKIPFNCEFISLLDNLNIAWKKTWVTILWKCDCIRGITKKVKVYQRACSLKKL